MCSLVTKDMVLTGLVADGLENGQRFDPLARYLNSLQAVNFFMITCRVPLFSNHLFQKIPSGIPSEWQTVWIQIRFEVCRA